MRCGIRSRYTRDQTRDPQLHDYKVTCCGMTEQECRSRDWLGYEMSPEKAGLLKTWSPGYGPIEWWLDHRVLTSLMHYSIDKIIAEWSRRLRPDEGSDSLEACTPDIFCSYILPTGPCFVAAMRQAGFLHHSFPLQWYISILTGRKTEAILWNYEAKLTETGVSVRNEILLGTELDSTHAAFSQWHCLHLFHAQRICEFKGDNLINYQTTQLSCELLAAFSQICSVNMEQKAKL